MSEQPQRNPIVVLPGMGEKLTVLGAGVRFLCEAEQTGGQFSVMVNDVPFGAGPPEHRHDWDEAYFVLSGKIAFVVDGKSILAESGCFIHAPANTLHAFSGASTDKVAKLLIIDAPAHINQFFREVDRKVTDESKMALLPAIGEAHGIHFG